MSGGLDELGVVGVDGVALWRCGVIVWWVWVVAEDKVQ
jgi:hypothetical protein